MLRRRKYVIALSTLILLLTSICVSLISSAKAAAPSDFSTPGSAPWGTTIDGSGRVWVALPGCDPSPTCSNSTPPGKLAVFNPTSNSWTATYTLPSGFGQALFTAFDQQGRLWFPLPMSNSIGMLNPANNTYQRWTVPTGGAGPWDIAVDSHGRVWFTEHYVNKIGVFDPSTQHFTEIATPASNSQPYGIVIDGSNNVWFTENNSAVALIAEYTAQGSLREYKIRNGSTSGLTPHLITIDHNGNIWWSEGWVAMIGELKVSQAQPGTNQGVTEYGYPHPCANCGTHTSGIAVDHSGNVWFDDSLQSTYGSFPVSGSSSFSMHATPTSNSHPHDGMNVDGQNRVYFDEETVNKLAVIPTSSAITPTPTSTPSPTPTKTGTPIATPTPGATLAQDTFQRANQSLWGKASDGLTWGGDANTATSFSISGNTGHVSGNSSSYSAVLGAAATNAEVLFSGSLSSFSNSNIGAVLRWTDGNNWYKAYIDGSNLVIQRKVAGTTTVLATTPFAASASTLYSLRFRVVGTTLSAKVWASAAAEPAAWMATASDTSFTSGSCGLRTLVQSGNTATFTAFSATSL